jgi:hypothetical protein
MELLHNKPCVAWCIIVVQKPLSLPFEVPLPLNCTVQPLPNVHIQMTSNTLYRQYENIAHQTVEIKEFRTVF